MVPIRTILIPCVALLACLTVTAQQLTAGKLLEKSVEYHDPAGNWSSFDHTLVFRESRPDGSARESRVTIDLPGELFIHDQKSDETHIVRQVVSGVCTGRLDGSSDLSEEQVQEHRLTCDRIRFYRDYYTFLWGLPMKLRDPGTRIDPDVKETTFMGHDVLAIRVGYDPEVGGDVWYHYFDPATYALVGYRFYHDESKNDGEYIVLEDEYVLGKMRLPKKRTWYVNADDRLLGTDELIDHE